MNSISMNRRLAPLAPAAAITLLQFQAVLTGILPTLEPLSATARNVLAGTPALAAFQNRVLAPLAQRAIELALGLPPTYAFLVLTFAAIGALNLAWVHWIGRAEDPRARWLAYLAFSASWVLLLDYANFLPWDVPDLLVFSLLAFAIADDRRLAYFVGLFAVAVLNRETALFIGLWLALSALWPRVDRRRLGVGVGLVAAGAAVVLTMRKLLNVQSIMPGDVAGGTYIAFGRNWSRLLDQLHFPASAPFLALLVLTAGLLALTAARSSSHDSRRLAAFALVLVVAGVTFGLWNETRVFLDVAPFTALILANVTLRSRPNPQTTA